MTKASIFSNNRSQAVRLPKDVALPADVKKVTIIKQGKSRLLIPEGSEWDGFFEGPTVTDDFMSERNQPTMQEREKL